MEAGNHLQRKLSGPKTLLFLDSGGKTKASICSGAWEASSHFPKGVIFLVSSKRDLWLFHEHMTVVHASSQAPSGPIHKAPYSLQPPPPPQLLTDSLSPRYQFPYNPLSPVTSLCFPKRHNVLVETSPQPRL